MVLCLLLFFGGQFRLVNYFDSEIFRSLSAYFGKTRSEMGYSASVPDQVGLKAICPRTDIIYILYIPGSK